MGVKLNLSRSGKTREELMEDNNPWRDEELPIVTAQLSKDGKGLLVKDVAGGSAPVVLSIGDDWFFDFKFLGVKDE